MDNRAKRALLGFLIAPATPGTLFVILSVFMGNLGEGIWAFQLMSLAAYAVALFIGVPIVIVLERFSIHALAVYILIGQILSLIPSTYFVVYPFFANPNPQVSLGTLPPAIYAPIAMIAFLGLITTLTYWFIAKPDRP